MISTALTSGSMRRKVCVFKSFWLYIIIIVGAANVETLKGALAQAQQEAKANKAAADKMAVELEAEQTTRRQHEARVAKVEQDLKDTIDKCETMEQKTSDQASKLARAL